LQSGAAKEERGVREEFAVCVLLLGERKNERDKDYRRFRTAKTEQMEHASVIGIFVVQRTAEL